MKKREDQKPDLIKARKENKFARFVHTKLVVRENRVREDGALGSQSTWGDPTHGRTANGSTSDAEAAAQESTVTQGGAAAAAAATAAAATADDAVLPGTDGRRTLRSGTNIAPPPRNNTK